jgi:ABC-2 type transport system permease protein
MSNTLTMTARSLRLSARSPEALLTALMLPVMLMVMFVYLFSGAVDIGTSYVTYVVPGVLLLCAVTGAASTAVTVSVDMTSGIIDRFRSLDVPGPAVLAGHVAASLVRNVISTALVTAVAVGIGFRPHTSVAAFAAAVGVLLLFVAAVSWLAGAFGLLVSAPEAANSAMFFLMFFSYASSAFVPVRTLPSWLRGFAGQQPSTPVTETIRGLLLGQPVGAHLGAALAWCLGILVASVAGSALLFARRTAELSLGVRADAGDGGARGAGQVGRGELDLEPAAPPAAEHGGEPQRGGVDHHGQALALAERGDAARHVSGGALGRGHRGHRGPLAAVRRGQGLEVELAVHRDHAHHQGAVNLGDQRLEHALGRHAQRLARFQAVGLVPAVMRVLVHGKGDAGAFERDRRRGAASCHDRSPYGKGRPRGKPLGVPPGASA